MAQVQIVKLEYPATELRPGSERVQDLLVDQPAIQFVQVRIPVGQVGRYHYHKDSDNVWIVTQGTIDAIVAGVRYKVGVGDVIFMPRGLPHSTGNNGHVEVHAVELYVPSKATGPNRDSHAAELPAIIVDAPLQPA
ncbi:MAG: cupin domain-containing protein [Fimbriimonadales bacterium]